MSEGPMRRRTGATFADVWPAAPKAPRGTRGASEVSEFHPGVTEGETRAAKSAPRVRQTATERVIAPRDQRISTETIEGKLLSHGPARYRFQPTEAPSYYARLLTPGGVVHLWGRGLALAIAKSSTQVRIGDRVAFRRLEQDPRSGRVQWRAEKPEWFVAHDNAARRSRDDQLAARRAGREDLELARAMMPLKAAQALAERHLSDPKQRLQFIAAVASRLKQTAREKPGKSAASARAQAQERTRSESRRSHRTRDTDLAR